MSVEIWVTGKHYRFSFDLGWYKGEEYTLLTIQLFECYDDRLHVIFSIKIAKFILAMVINKVD